MMQRLLVRTRLLLVCATSILSLATAGTAAGRVPDPANKIAYALVKGKITNPTGDPLLGVTITVKGTNTSTSTNGSGSYSINAPGNGTLVFSYVGYTTQEVAVNGRSEINVVLEASAASLDQVVVVGYGTVRRKDLTGSVTSVKATDVVKNVDMSLNSALQGRAAGVQVTSTAGGPGAAVNISIRAGSSISASNDPLYVIDGFPQLGGSNLNINPNDVASIEILKDASATAIYGSRGANGVIIITTKMGRNGRFSVSYDGYYGIQQLGRKMEVLNSQEYAMLRHQLGSKPANSGIGDTTFYNWESFKDSLNIDWQDKIFRTAAMQTHNISFTGGTENLKVSGSIGYMSQDGIAINTNAKRYNARLNTIATINKNITNITTIYLSQNHFSGPEVTGLGGVLYSTLRASPYKTPGYENSLTDFVGSSAPGSTNGNNPYADLTLSKINRVNSFSNINTSFNIKLMEELTLRLAGGVNYSPTTYNYFYPSETGEGYYNKGSGGNTVGSATNLLNENTLSYSKALGASHKLDVLAGFTVQTNTSTTNTVSITNFPTQSLGYDNLGFGTQLRTPSSSRQKSGIASYLGRVNYAFLDKYLLTASFRADGSSKFQQQKWGYFPSAAFAWKVNDENFMQNVAAISTLKFRASWGMTGNESIAPYSSFTTYSPYYGGPPVINETIQVGLGPTQLGSADLKWETTSQTNVGIDLGIIKDRIFLTVDAYKKKTKDLLLYAPISNYSGFTSVLRNVGNIEVKGIELDLNTVNLTGKFRWNTNFNIAFNRSKVLNLNQGQTFFYTGGIIGRLAPTAHIVQVGQPLGEMYGFINDGLNNTQEEFVSGALNQTTVSGVGARKYRDINRDGVINENDQTIIGNGNPKFFGGFNNDFSYGPFELSGLFAFSYGNDVINVHKGMLEQSSSNGRTALNGWSPENPQVNVTAHGGGGPNVEFNYLSTYIIEDGSYLRLKNVMIAYNLSAAMVKKLPFQSLRVYITGQNLLTFTKYTGYDPEVNLNNSIITPGIDMGAYPHSKIYTLGLNVNF